MKYVKYLWAGIVLLLGGFFFERSKAKSAEALTENDASKEQVQAIQADKDKANAGIQSEEEKRADIQKQAEAPQSSTDADLLDFLNKK